MPKARKNYSCDLCELPISKGSDYHYQRVTPWDHPDNECFGNFRAHRYCYSVWCELAKETDYEFNDVDTFREEVAGGVVVDYEALKAIVNQPAVECKQCQTVTFPRMKGVDGSPYCSSHCYNKYLGVGCDRYCVKCEREKRPVTNVVAVEFVVV